MDERVLRELQYIKNRSDERKKRNKSFLDNVIESGEKAYKNLKYFANVTGDVYNILDSPGVYNLSNLVSTNKMPGV